LLSQMMIPVSPALWAEMQADTRRLPLYGKRLSGVASNYYAASA